MSEWTADLYTLHNAGGENWGVFTTPEKAMRAVYLTYVDSVYHAWNADIPKFTWVKSGWHYYAYDESEVAQKPMLKVLPKWEIRPICIDWMPGAVESELVNFATSRNLPMQAEVHPIKDAL